MHFALKKKPVDNYQRRHYALHSCWTLGWGGEASISVRTMRCIVPAVFRSGATRAPGNDGT